MRCRHVIAAIVAAVGLAVFAPMSADAATGTFTYLYPGQEGPQTGILTDPADTTCVPLPEVGWGTPAAFEGTNNTDKVVLAFEDRDCRANPILIGFDETAQGEFRSVLFAD
jgi:hypothetical protein